MMHDSPLHTHASWTSKFFNYYSLYKFPSCMHVQVCICPGMATITGSSALCVFLQLESRRLQAQLEERRQFPLEERLRERMVGQEGPITTTAAGARP